MKILAVLFGLFIAIILISLFLWLPFFFLWNWLMPVIFALPEITIWQALGLIFLSAILFKSAGSSK